MLPKDRLQLFVSRANELASKRAVQKGLSHHVSVEFRQGQGFEVKEKAPDTEDFHSFLVVFRKFIMPGEPIFLHSIFNLLKKCLTDSSLSEGLKEARGAWKIVSQSGIAFEINGKRLQPEETADLWIQKRIFHDDEGADILDQLPPPGEMLLKAQFMDFVLRTTEIIFYVADVIRKAFEDGSIDVHCQ